MRSLLTTSNILPYILLVALSYGTYTLWESKIQTELKLEEAKENAMIANESIAIIQGYNEKRFEELSEVRKTKWKEGYHEGSF